MMRRIGFSVLFFLALFAFGLSLEAQDFSSDNFTVSTPVMSPGGRSTSDNFILVGAISQFASGSSEADTFKLFGGFLYFPFVSTPAVTATAGNAEVALTWSAAETALGWTASYAVGKSTISGGPYTFGSVISALASTQTGLTNGTTYYFVVRVLDVFSNVIATSTQVSATPVAPSGGGGGGGGGGITYGTGGVNFSGRAYPRSTITILKDAQIAVTTIADATSNFVVSLTNLTAGNYFFSVYSEDNQGKRSSLVTFPVGITSGVTTNITGIFIAPTIAVDKSQVRKGDNIAIFGQTTVQSEVTIEVNSDQQFFVKTLSDQVGVYLYNFDTAPLELGDHSTRSKAAKGNEISPYSLAAAFVVGNTSILVTASKKICDKRGDVNADCKVNLVDFSIVAYWYNRPAPPRNVDINSDGKVSLVDFSIMAYNWTG